MNKVNIFYGIILILVASCSFRISMYTFIISTILNLRSVTADQNELNKAND